jgi:hypothetical protein
MKLLYLLCSQFISNVITLHQLQRLLDVEQEWLEKARMGSVRKPIQPGQSIQYWPEISHSI